MRCLIAFTCAMCFALAPYGFGQTDDPRGDETPRAIPLPGPLTRLESLLNLRGVVMIKGYTEIGTIEGDYGSSVRITAVELTDPARREREHGLAITVRQGGDPIVDAVSYVDFDEIDALLAALDALGKVDASATAMEHVDAEYRTRGDLEIASIERERVRYVQVRSIQMLPTTQIITAQAVFPVNRLGEIHRQVTAARQALEAARQSNK